MQAISCWVIRCDWMSFQFLCLVSGFLQNWFVISTLCVFRLVLIFVFVFPACSSGPLCYLSVSFEHHSWDCVNQSWATFGCHTYILHLFFTHSFFLKIHRHTKINNPDKKAIRKKLKNRKFAIESRKV